MNASRAARKFEWYARRLAAMSPAETAHRVAERRRRRRFRSYELRAPSWLGDAVPALPLVRERLATATPEDLLLWRAHARLVSEGRLTLLGARWPSWEDSPDWNLDPVTGSRWPQTYCFDVDFRHGSGLDDVKYVWELHRLQYLQPIAAVAMMDGDGEAAQLCARHLDSWLRANPPGRGVAWASGIELGLRAISMLVVTSAIGNRLPAPVARRLSGSLLAHAEWIEAFPSRYSSANNHRIAELTGLIAVRAAFPEWPERVGKIEKDTAELCAEVGKQIYPDGIGAEQSPTYTAFTLEMAAFALVLAQNAGVQVELQAMERLESAADAMAVFADGNGRLPRIGDDDEGRVFWGGVETDTYATCVAASLKGIGAHPCGASHPLRHRIFEVDGMRKLPLVSGAHHFVRGGITVVRSDGPGVRILTFDHGPLGYLSIAAHGHADALAITLTLDDRQVLVDAGTFMYHAGGTWRDYFRGTRAHNTVVVGDENSSIISGPFMWSHHAQVRVKEFSERPDGGRVVGEHDGYRRRFGVTHRRTLDADANGFALIDELLGRERDVEAGFLFHPDVALDSDGRGFVASIDGRAVMRAEFYGASRIEVERPGDQTAWYSAGFGIKMATTRLAVRGRAGEGRRIVSRFSYLRLDGGLR